ncbi:MAG: D-aminoacylase [Candidatus Omnitrophica bacterium]|nr:D-aminoacylase [Candidatus Omnitrophota bacterium]
MHDLLIKNGTIINGTGSPCTADIGIEGEKITAVGKIKQSAKKCIDASGMCVAPGFIDFHSHNDRVILGKNIFRTAKITQGITTEVVGNCGFSSAPSPENEKDRLLERDRNTILGQLKGAEEPFLWNDYVNVLSKMPLAANVVPLAGHGNIRMAVMGIEDRPASTHELAGMKRILTGIMESGGWGMSTGLVYPPGVFTPEEELVELSSVLKRFDGIYASHVRGEGPTLFPAVKEVLSIGRKSGISVQVSHLKAPPDKVDEMLEMLYKARDNGINVNYDQYPYAASSTTAGIILPRWMHEGGEAKLLSRLSDISERRKARRDITAKGSFYSFLGPDKILVNQVKTLKNRRYEGRTLLEVAEDRGVDPLETLFDIIAEEKSCPLMVFFSMSEESVKRIMKEKIGFVGTDGLPGRRPHPRLWGTFPRILGRYVREGKILSLDEAVYKFSKAPAEKLKLKGRGEIKKGNFADIVIFDAGKVTDRATYQNPNRRPEGIDYVIVNGMPVVEKGMLTGLLPGRLLLKF